jgi:hypothetical protein
MVKKEYPSVHELKAHYASNKVIPAIYEEPILRALSHFPELQAVKIDFVLKDRHPVPYGTAPTFASYFKDASRRKYVITIAENAEGPTKLVLFKNLPEEAQRGVIGHELGHVVAYQRSNTADLLKYSLMYSNMHLRRKAERGADICAIEHGLGFELYVHAVYIRRIPGYIELRKEIDTDYLKPQEILDTFESAPEVGETA